MSDHLHRLQTVYDERFAREYGPWRPVMSQVADKFLACGVLEHGFARIRCNACTHEYLLAFSCKCRYFCPSCHAKRLAIWTQWLDTTLLAQWGPTSRPIRPKSPTGTASGRPTRRRSRGRGHATRARPPLPGWLSRRMLDDYSIDLDRNSYPEGRAGTSEKVTLARSAILDRILPYANPCSSTVSSAGC